jgi:uncharacterized repeat protein (TIGR03833 family)
VLHHCGAAVKFQIQYEVEAVGGSYRRHIERKARIISMNGIRKSDINPGLRVLIVLKTDQRTGKLTGGIVKDVLTKSAVHPHGIKVRLESGQVGRVKEIR